MRVNVHLLRLAAFSAIAGAALAQVPAVTSFTGSTAFGSIDATDQTIGYTFTPTSNIVVSALGVWEQNTGVNLTQTHQVGLWTAGGALLASGTVPLNSTVTGSWRYVSITPVTLTAGQTYVAGSEILSPFTDTYSRVDLPGGTVTTNALITLGVSATNASAGGFSFPNATSATVAARLGPNLLVAAAPPTPPPTSVPDSPWTLGLIGTGLALVGSFFLGMRGRERASF
jgi:Domain of unknown function (DUF4082)